MIVELLAQSCLGVTLCIVLVGLLSGRSIG